MVTADRAFQFVLTFNRVGHIEAVPASILIGTLSFDLESIKDARAPFATWALKIHTCPTKVARPPFQPDQHTSRKHHVCAQPELTRHLPHVN
ncbi:MAG: hypothetical protein H0U72_13680 [Nitrosospira sp.]|nr:hypothetical protein [Nitrosospira sp.]